MPTIDMATVLSQIPHVQTIAGAEHSIPAAQQAAIAQSVQQAFEDQRNQVQKIEQSEALETVSKDKDKDKKRRQAAYGRKGQESEAPAEPETTASNASPWSGNIIDVKI